VHRRTEASIVGPDNKIKGAISISAPLERCREERFHETFPRIIQESANVIQINIDTGQYYF
jgi:DNA-binding IclR family transcriptional regulator